MGLIILCKVCDGALIHHKTGSMGSFHSNFYKCNGCGRVVEIQDNEIHIVLRR